MPVMNRRHKKGVTLLEACIWVVVGAVLAVIAWPRVERARRIRHYRICVMNLRMIDHAKQQLAAAQQSMEDSYAPTMSELRPFFKGNPIPVCPDGGTYFVRPITNNPTCTKSGKGFCHYLPHNESPDHVPPEFDK
jgi:hypothetical protein